MSVNIISMLGRYALAPRIKSRKKIKVTKESITGYVEKAFNAQRLQLKKLTGSVLTRRDTDAEKLINITKGAQKSLISATTVFPFVLFPDTIIIDRQKLTIIHRTFFSTASTTSVQIDDVQIAKVDVGPFFGSIQLASKYFVDNIQSINFLKRSDAIAIQRLLQGYMIAHHRKIDCSSIDNDQLVILLNDLGQSTS